jgi:Spy/CpxP family protein refolding chaperone
LSNGVFRPPPWLRRYIGPEQRRKLIKDYIRARDAYRRAIEEERRDYQELIRLGLICADPKKSEQ